MAVDEEDDDHCQAGTGPGMTDDEARALTATTPTGRVVIATIDHCTTHEEEAEAEAFDLLRKIVNLARDSKDYRDSLLKLKALLPKAPGVQEAINQAAARYAIK